MVPEPQQADALQQAGQRRTGRQVAAAERGYVAHGNGPHLRETAFGHGLGSHTESMPGSRETGQGRFAC